MPLSDLLFLPLDPSIDLSQFDCGDKDITDWLKDDAVFYQNEKMANTYLFMDGSDILAYFCISNDCLNDQGQTDGYPKNAWNRFHRKVAIPNEKRIKSYPAVKIGRLGVCLKQHGNGLAYELMDFIKGFAVREHKPACRLLLLDAYNKPKQIKYYTRNEFVFLQEEDKEKDKRIMYFDLQRLA